MTETCARPGGHPSRAEPYDSSEVPKHKQGDLYNEQQKLNHVDSMHDSFLLQPSSLLFRTLEDTSHQRTGLVYSPLRGDMATHQTSGGGRADVFYQIRDALSSNLDNVILTCCFII